MTFCSNANLKTSHDSTSKSTEKSDFSFPSDFIIHQISPGKNINLRNCGRTSSKYDRSDFSLPSEFRVKLASLEGIDQKLGNKSFDEDTGMGNLVYSYDWNKDLDNGTIDMKFSNFAPGSKVNAETLISPMKGWNRVFQKYSPSTEIFHSPIKQIEANIKPNITNDDLTLAQVWIVGMSEQFYYDNSITLIHKYHDVPADLNQALIINSRFMNTEEIMDTFVDVAVLGRGGFGDVYRVRKKGTSEYMAVKFLKKAPTVTFYEHTHELLEYLKEKNSFIKARNSPFIVQFINSFKFNDINGLFLLFEWCFCNLRKYIKLFVYETDLKNVTKSLWDGEVGGIKNLKTKPFTAASMDFLTVTIIYIFEVFCALDFLAKCNIVHQDLKPENVMIAINLHLKVADFGLTYNTSFVTRRTQVHLVDVNEINVMESSNYKPVWGGTYLYQDMELCYRTLLKENEHLVKDVINNDDHFDFELSNDKKDADPNFMSDLWACGIIATELIFGGAHIFRPEHIPDSMRVELTARWNFSHNVLIVTYIKRNYSRYIVKGFINYGGPAYEELMTFLGSIFKPRQERADDFVMEKEVYRYKNKARLKHIDINKVEKISVFTEMGLTSNNVFLYSMPRKLSGLMNEPLDTKYKTLRHFLATIPNYSNKDFIDLKPGIESNYF